MGMSAELGLGEYLALYAIIGVVAFGILGGVMGTGLAGVLVFIIGGSFIVILGYAVLARFWNFLLHGSFSRGGDSRGDGRV